MIQSQRVEALHRHAEPFADTGKSLCGDISVAEVEQSFLKALVDSADDAIVSKDLNGIITSWNPGAERTFGYTASEMDDSVRYITADSDRLQQVVWNLLSNAIKFTPRGGRVELRSRNAGNEVEISVRDTGEGISADFLPYVFERFRQADATTTRQHAGIGVGLAVVRHLVEAHGGAVEANSDDEGQGATFVVRLPRLKEIA